MKFIELANSRYTTKSYNPSQTVSDQQIEELKEILRLSPSSINSQPWQFTFVADKNMKSELAAASYFNAKKIEDASHLVVFSALTNIGLFEEHIQKNLPAGAVGYYHQFIQPKNPQEIQGWLAHQVYLSLGIFLSACVSMGIDSTPMEGIEADKYRSILNSKDYQPLFAVAIGYRDSQDTNQPIIKPKSRLAMEAVVVSV